jgi:hypothetical protein
LNTGSAKLEYFWNSPQLVSVPDALVLWAYATVRNLPFLCVPTRLRCSRLLMHCYNSDEPRTATIYPGATSLARSAEAAEGVAPRLLHMYEWKPQMYEHADNAASTVSRIERLGGCLF